MENKDKIILHLCAGPNTSDSHPYRVAGYTVIPVGKDYGVENFHLTKEKAVGWPHISVDDVYGIFANPVCTEFSTARSTGKARNPEEGMKIVRECQRIIAECPNLKFWVIENPATGVLRHYLGKPVMTYEPWHFGSPWTKRTALWGKFNKPKPLFKYWGEVPKIFELYIRPGRLKPSLAFLHKSAIKFIPEFWGFVADSDMEFRSLCSQRFAQAFFKANP